jgi:hypothetical protein
MWKRFGPLNLPAWEKELLALWEEEKTFERTLAQREGRPAFVFYEGPPSANGKPGIHHVFSRTLKDLVCRYQTMKGYYVLRRAGWDTHGLPVELSVEKELGITRADIGKKISISDYNKACREAVMRYKASWDELTRRMGYWVRLDDPYITFDPKYIESVWFLLKKFYEKGLLYKSYTIQPYSPAAGHCPQPARTEFAGSLPPREGPLPNGSVSRCAGPLPVLFSLDDDSLDASGQRGPGCRSLPTLRRGGNLPAPYPNAHSGYLSSSDPPQVL